MQEAWKTAEKLVNYFSSYLEVKISRPDSSNPSAQINARTIERPVNRRRVKLFEMFAREFSRLRKKVWAASAVINSIQVGIDDPDFDRKVEHHVVAPLRVGDADHLEVDAESVF